jgi:nitroreductase
MDFNALLDSRYSSREYTAKPVTDESIGKILLAIEAAPSAANLQSYFVVVIKDLEVKEQLTVASKNQRWMMKAPVFLCFFADITQYEKKFGDYMKDITPIQDATIAMAYAQLAANNLGLGACWVASHAREGIDSIFKLEGNMMLIGILTVGYPADSKPKRKRRKPEEWSQEI